MGAGSAATKRGEALLLLFATMHSATLYHFPVRHNQAKRSIPTSETCTRRYYYYLNNTIGSFLAASATAFQLGLSFAGRVCT